MNTDDKIRAILQMEADAVEPSPAGYDAIREGIANRRQRTWWVRGSAFAGVGLTTAAALVVLSSNPAPQTIQQPPAASSSATATSSATAEPSPTAPATPQPPTSPNDALGTIWPLTTRAELSEWQEDPRTYPSLATASNSALAFARNYLLVHDATVAADGAAKDGVLFFDVRRGEQVVSTLELRAFGPEESGPYLVTRATSEAVKISSPVAGEEAGSPIRVKGDYHEVDPGILVRLRADGPGSAPIELGDNPGIKSPPNTWEAELAYATTARTGSIMVTIGHNRGDGISAAAVVPVLLTPSTGTPAGDVLAGVRDQRVALFTPAGSLVRYLTEQQPGGGAYDPDVSPDGTRVVWSQGAGTCATVAQYAPVAGGEPVVVGDGRGLSTKPTWVGDGRIAYANTSCDEKTELRIYDLVTKTSRTLASLPEAPAALAASPDGKHLAYIVGNTLTRYEIGTGATDVVPAYAGCRWRAVDVFGTSTVGEPMLMTATTCEREAGLLIDRFATNAPERERVTELKHDGVVYRVSYDQASKSFLVSHGVEDDESYVERFGADGSLLVLRKLSYASW